MFFREIGKARRLPALAERLRGSAKLVLAGALSLALTQPSFAVISNTATVTASSPGLTNDVTGSDTEQVDVQDAAPAMVVTNTSPTTNVTATGTAINYTITVDNTGNIALTGLVIADSLKQGVATSALTLTGPTGDTNADGKLNVDEIWTYTASHTVTQANMNNGSSLVATASVTTTQTGATPVTKAFTTTLAPLPPSFTVEGNTNVTSVNAVGNSIYKKVKITNTGGVTLQSFTLTDPIYNFVCPSSGNATIATLDPYGEEICGVSYSATQADFDTNGGGDGFIDSTVTVSATAANPAATAVSGSYTNSVTIVRTKSLLLAKSADTSGPVQVGDVINYFFEVTNNGNVTQTNVHVVDNHNGSGPDLTPWDEELRNDGGAATNDSTDGVVDGIWDTLAPGDTIRLRASYTVTQHDVDTLQ